jgi:hypothetical protein
MPLVDSLAVEVDSGNDVLCFIKESGVEAEFDERKYVVVVDVGVDDSLYLYGEGDV